MPALTLAVLVMRKVGAVDAAGHRGAGVVEGGRVGVVLVQRHNVGDTAAAGGDLQWSGSGAASAAGQAAQGHGQAALLVCSVPIAVGGADQVRPTRASVRVTLTAALGPALSKVMM